MNEPTSAMFYICNIQTMINVPKFGNYIKINDVDVG